MYTKNKPEVLKCIDKGDSGTKLVEQFVSLLILKFLVMKLYTLLQQNPSNNGQNV